jgi:succinyl-diaminopimelate desuccinylase
LSEEFVRSVYAEMIPIVAVGPDNGGEGELERAKYLEELLLDTGFREIRRLDARDPRAKGGVRPNLLARLYGKSAPTLWVVAHIDTVPPGDLSLWRTPPYEPSFSDDTVFGRGTEDDGQGVLLGACVAKKLLEQDKEKEFDFGLALVSDEETGSVYGVQHILEQRAFSRADLFLIPDAGNSAGSLVEVAEKSVLWLRIKVEGSQTHASTPEKGVNACRLGSVLLVELDRSLHHSYPEADGLFDPAVSTFEPTKREPNVENVNTIPGTDTFYLDCRLLPFHDVEEVLEMVKKTAREFAETNHVKVSVETVNKEGTAPPTDVNSPFVKALLRELAKRDIVPRAGGIGGGTVARYFRRAGYPSVVWMTCDETAHAPNEYAKVSNILMDAETVTALFLGL